MGQATYGSQALAAAASFTTEMSNFSSVAQEGVILYQMIYQRGAAFGAPGNARLMQVNKVTSSISTIAAGSGTVVSVGLTDGTGLFNVSGSPVTSSGNLSLSSLVSQSANTVFAAPNGSSGAPTFRTLVFNDLPVMYPIVAKSAGFTAANNNTYFVSTGSAMNIQLPAPSANLTFLVKDVTGTAHVNPMTLVRAGSEKIENVAASYVLNASYGAWTILSDGTDWFII